KSLFILVPILIALGYHRQADFFYYLNIIPLTVLLPFISVSFATLLSLPFVLVKNFLKNHNVISALLSLLLFVGIFFIVYWLVAQIPIPIRLVQLYNRFIIGLTLFMQDVATVGSVYSFVGYVLYGIDAWLNYLYVVLIVIGLSLANYFIAKPLYFKLTSSSQENTVKKVKHMKLKESKALFFTF